MSRGPDTWHDGMPEVSDKDEDRQRRNRLIGIFSLCLTVFIVILGVSIGVPVAHRNNEPSATKALELQTARPNRTASSTFSPADYPPRSPTLRPSQSLTAASTPRPTPPRVDGKPSTLAPTTPRQPPVTPNSAGRPDGAQCVTDDDCASGKCGLQSYSTQAPYICCDGGNALPVASPWDNNEQVWVCSNLPLGAACNDDRSCASGHCINGICANPDTTTDNKDLQSCQFSSQCDTKRCGRADYRSDAPWVCCPYGDAMYFDVYWSTTHQWVCSHLNVGEPCNDDRSCQSTMCLNQICIEEPQADESPCDSDFDCLHKQCGRMEYDANAPYVCCTDGDAILLDVPWNDAHEYFCSHRKATAKCAEDQLCQSGICVGGICIEGRIADGQPCVDDRHCNSNYCGRQEYKADAPMVCCPQGDAIIAEQDFANPRDWICLHIPTGAACAMDVHCDSRVCVDGVCVAEPLADLATCDSDTDCLSGWCGRSASSDTAPKVCCTNGRYNVEVINNLNEFVCSMDGAFSQKVDTLAVGASCTKHLECQSRACGMQEFVENAPLVCCQDGASYKLQGSWGYGTFDFCGNLGVGAACGNDDRLCNKAVSSGCVLGKCAATRLADGATCQKDTDCEHYVCGKAGLTEDAPRVCCANGESYSVQVPWGYAQETVCGDLPVGTVCGDYTRMCESGLCVEGVCVNATLPDGAVCLKDMDCQTLACAKTSKAADATKQCCAEGKNILLHFTKDNLPDWYCADVKRPELAHCTRHEQCESGKCDFSNNLCAASAVT